MNRFNKKYFYFICPVFFVDCITSNLSTNQQKHVLLLTIIFGDFVINFFYFLFYLEIQNILIYGKVYKLDSFRH